MLSRFATLATLGFLLGACHGDGEADPSPPQMVFSGVSVGCGAVEAVMATTDDTQYLVVEVRTDHLAGSTDFDLARRPEGVSVRIDAFGRPLRHSNYCTDAITLEVPEPKMVQWKAEAGRLHVEVGPKEKSGAYSVELLLDGVRFVGPDGTRVMLPRASTAVRAGLFLG